MCEDDAAAWVDSLFERVAALDSAAEAARLAALKDPCANCTLRRSRKCASCGKRVCPKHVSKVNGCCAECLEDVQQAFDKGCCSIADAEAAEITALGGGSASVYGEL
eukprot:3747781-Prymnesium_polylepis.1